MKNMFLVSYDIMHHTRLYKVFKVMKGFGDHIQYSVFFCHLNPSEKVMMNDALLREMNQKEDRIMIVNLGPSEGTSKNRIELLGRQEPPEDPAPRII